ncbi:MAG: hypothetical protein H6P99_644, partial [Holophagaceae bacterium]|nr:hypothetical protein [Holophagaceae bacterium]
ADEADTRRDHPEIGPRLAALPKEMRHLLKRVRAYAPPKHDPVVDKVRHLGDLAWLTARLTHPPATKEALERTIPNPRFRRKRLDALWAVFAEGAHETQENGDASDGLIWNNPGRP